jgi:HEAT repeat protein
MRTIRGSRKTELPDRLRRRKAQALHSADELLAGTRDPDWRVRYEAVLVARWKDDPRTLDAIMSLATDDDTWQVRDTAAIELLDFDRTPVEATARSALEDNPDVRWSAR